MEKKSKLLKECELCGENPISVCFQCKLNLCEQCKKYVHSLKKNSDHKIESIDPFIPIDLKCPDHPENALNLFCANEKGNLYHIFINFYL